MNNPTLEQIAKLPKWAQDEIARLTRRRDEAVTELKNYLDAQTPSRAYTEDYGEARRYIRADRLHFALPNGSLCIQIGDDSLRCTASGYGEFVVVPGCSNVVELKLIERA